MLSDGIKMASFPTVYICVNNKFQKSKTITVKATMDRPVSKSDTEAPKVGIADPKLDIRNTKSDVEDPRIANEKEREKGLGDE
ncbi:hypothetical protein BC943DRAFT_358729, partial [Umbelopsis sp. AD052]